MRIGVDLGGTKIEAIALDRDGQIAVRQRMPTPTSSYSDLLSGLKALIELVGRGIDPQCSVGIGIPGSLAPETGLARNSNLAVLNGHPLDRDLEHLMKRPVRVANDANCFALSEGRDGAARGLRVVFGAILGTGCGGGLVIDGQIWNGANGIAGEWGHNRLGDRDAKEFPGPECYCGRRGCIETFVSGRGLERDFLAVTGRSLAAHEICTAAERGDSPARAALARLELRLAQALASIINVLDPDAIVLGGGLSNWPGLYDSVPRLWNEYTFGQAPRTRLLKALHGDSSGVRGAAWLWPGA